MSKNIKSTQYLYDCEPLEFAEMKYIDALYFKIEKGKILLNRLLEPHYADRDDERINHVLSAIKFNEKLINEIKNSKNNKEN